MRRISWKPPILKVSSECNGTSDTPVEGAIRAETESIRREAVVIAPEGKELIREGRNELINQLIPDDHGMTLRHLNGMMPLASGEVFSQIVVSRASDPKIRGHVKASVSIFFGTGDSPSEQCLYEIHLHLGGDGEVLRVNLPKAFYRGKTLVKRTALYTPQNSVNGMFEGLLAQADNYLLLARQLPHKEVPANHSVRRTFSITP